MKVAVSLLLSVCGVLPLAVVNAATVASFDGGADSAFTLQGFGTGDPLPPPPSVQPVGGLSGGYLRITSAENSQHNWVTFDRTDPGSFQVSNFSFAFRIAIGAVPSADGFSFSYASTANWGTTGGLAAPNFTAEDPAAAGILGFGFDTWSNGPPFDNPAVATGSDYSEISLFWNGAVINRVDDTRPLGLTIDDGLWKQVEGSVNFGTGIVNMEVDGIPIFTNVSVPGLTPFESRLMFAGRTGGENEDAGIDNLNVTWVPEPATMALGLIGTALIFRRRRK